MINFGKRFGGVLVAAAMLNGAAHGAVVFYVDVSNPAAVVFTATDAASLTDSSLNGSQEGITVDDFFSAPQDYPSMGSGLPGNLSAVGGGAGPYAGFGTFVFEANDGAFVPGQDLSIYYGGNAGAGSQVFQSGSVAFQGSTSFNFSGSAAALPSVGTTGNVYTGFFESGTADHGEIIGEWTVVPEPSSVILTIAGGLGLMARRRRSMTVVG